MTCTWRVARISGCLIAGAVLVACQVDDSMPSRPRTSNPFAPDAGDQENAERRALESPQRELPTSGREFPGQSAAPSGDQRVLTLQVSSSAGPADVPLAPPGPQGFRGPSGWAAFGNTSGPTNVYHRDAYPGPLPLLPQNPGDQPMLGSTPVAGGAWSIDHSWGQGLAMSNDRHRPWPTTNVESQSGSLAHNPTHYFTIQQHLKVPQNTGTVRDDWVSVVYEVPWFFLNTAALPVLVLLEPPLAVRTTVEPSYDPSYRGYLSSGSTIPAPTRGEMRWEYPFLNPDGTVKPLTSPTTGPSTVPVPRVP